MKFLILTHVIHKRHDSQWFAYAPYVREMNAWLKYVDEVEIVAPCDKEQPTHIDMAYQHGAIKFTRIPEIAFVSFKRAIFSMLLIPKISIKIFKACLRADHIHLRCPGNIGLLGCLVQIFFPHKTKTAKYAGNWDPKAKQPLSYRFQKWLLSHTFLTKNMQVLVYGHWENQSKNIKPFFTATFKDEEKQVPIKRHYHAVLHFVFIGSLVAGKRPLFAVKVVEALSKQGRKVRLDIYGDGILKNDLEQYIIDKHLESIVKWHGNQQKVLIKAVLKTAHFLILPSKSEGWPKAIAEAMFFGAIPIAAPISCVPDMLDYGKRGILITAELDHAIHTINTHLDDEATLQKMSEAASKWSQHYTLDVFETEISKLLQHS
ncbi:glycosyltransferase family 4 protein [Flavisericum labens]|uniref:glycosyltransferase family 4 protein n=1 Tax=Flavisericum labens TaxID=3377112 RepID=UPI00387B0A84